MFTSVTRALSGPISILMTGMYHLGSIQSVLCTRGPLLLRSHLVSSGPYWSQTHVGKKKKKGRKFPFLLVFCVPGASALNKYTVLSFCWKWWISASGRGPKSNHSSYRYWGLWAEASMRQSNAVLVLQSSVEWEQSKTSHLFFKYWVLGQYED